MPEGIDATAYRQVMGHFATGVTVVTTAVDGQLQGMTASSIASVSLDPILILVCVAHKARTHEELKKSGRFGVSVLSVPQAAMTSAANTVMRLFSFLIAPIPFRPFR